MLCPTFGKLKTLLLNEWSVAIDLVALICFLQHTPVITLQLCEARDWMEKEGNYNPTENPFASKQVERSVIHSEGNSAIDTVTATAEDLLAAAAATDPLRYHSQLPKYSAPISQRPPQANLYP